MLQPHNEDWGWTKSPPWLELGTSIAFDLNQALNSNAPANLHKFLCIGFRLKLTFPELRKETEL